MSVVVGWPPPRALVDDVDDDVDELERDESDREERLRRAITNYDAAAAFRPENDRNRKTPR